ncbi:sporulation protein [Catellatospora sp. NEAU-YM18]|nr:sporulation protein [Catellatospora tritici]
MDTIGEVVDHASANKVFGSPISQDGITVLPVAKVNGGGGGGGGGQPEAGHEGGGFGLSAKPLGVFVIKEGRVGWRPAVDVNKVIIGGQIVLVVALLTLRAIMKARRRS